MELFINTYGANLNKCDGMFLIESNSQPQKVSPFMVDKIVLTTSATISTDAIALALEHDIEIVIIEKRGGLIGHFWHGKNFSVSTIRQGQALFSVSPESNRWIAGLIKEKIINQAQLLLHLNITDVDMVDGFRQTAVDSLDAFLQSGNGRLKDKVRSAEGRFSKFYFAQISKALPVAYRFSGRSKRPAHDMFNAALNYSYGILYSRVTTALTRAGLDPYLGILHANEYNTPSLTFDFIEPFRPWADYVVIDICRQELLNVEHFEVTDNTYSLNENGKKILIPAYMNYMHSKKDFQGKRLTRFNHVYYRATQFAQVMKSHYKEIKKKNQIL